MEGARCRDFRQRRQWTLGFLMIVIAAVGLVCALLKPLTASPPPSREVIGVGFDLQETRLPDGSWGMGIVPKTTVTKHAGAAPPARKP